MDLFPTVAEIASLPDDIFVRPIDGISLNQLFTEELRERPRPIPFRFGANAAIIDNRYKLLTENLPAGKFRLYDLKADPQESEDLSNLQPDRSLQLKEQLLAWNRSVEASLAGKDYPEEQLTSADPVPAFWYETADYQQYLARWKNRWEYRTYIERRGRAKRRESVP
jgi:hypothetical protein